MKGGALINLTSTVHGKFSVGIIFAATLIFALTARAGDWKLTAGLGVTESFSDNIDLASDGQDANSDLITRVTPRISLRGTGGRGFLNFNLSRSESFHRLDSTRDSSNNNLLGSGQVEIWNRIAFIDAQASITQQVVDSSAATSNSVAGQNVNRTETIAYNISPFFRHHFGAWAETESRTTISGVKTASSASDDTTTISNHLTISSGRRFTSFQWGLVSLNSKTKSSDDSPSTKTTRIDGNVTYVLHRKLSLLSGVGYERIEDPSLTTEPKGMNWNVGFSARPSSKTDLRFTIGDRNDTTTIDFQGSHRLSPRTTITANFSETLQTTEQQITNDLSFLTLDPSGSGTLIDSRTGSVFTGSTDAFGIQNDTFRQQVFRLQMSGRHRRNTYVGGFFWESRKTDSTNITETVLGSNLSLSRRLSTRSSGSLGLTYRNTDFGTVDLRTEDELLINAGYNYRIKDDLTAALAYNLTVRKVNNAADPADLKENSVSLSLSKSF
ncbi:MAG: TIGR03016 family PEP-CTERM system-associated outer membrane protein [Alphaproteobacteria bacterium]|nr:TIGR03016 family PEP-CTERM system-associated outer membrane protein [Alphaproteobacteria bacterium]